MAKLAKVSKVASKVRKNVSSSLAIKNFDIKWILIAILVGIVIFIVVKFIKNSTRSIERFQDTCPPPSVTKDQYLVKLNDYVANYLWNKKKYICSRQADVEGLALADLLGLPYNSIKQDLKNLVDNEYINIYDSYIAGPDGFAKGGGTSLPDITRLILGRIQETGKPSVEELKLINTNPFYIRISESINAIWDKYLLKEADDCAAKNAPASESSAECPTMDEESCSPFISPLKSKLTEANNQIANESNCASYVTASSCNQFISPIETQLTAANAERASDATCLPYINEASCRNYIDPIKNDLEARLRVSLSKEANATTCAPFITIAPPPPPKKSPPPPPKRSSPPPPKRSPPPPPKRR